MHWLSSNNTGSPNASTCTVRTIQNKCADNKNSKHTVQCLPLAWVADLDNSMTVCTATRVADLDNSMTVFTATRVADLDNSMTVCTATWVADLDNSMAVCTATVPDTINYASRH